jgi:hypothetical protein
MSTTAASGTSVASFTQVTKFFADKMMMLLGNIVRDSGLDMATFTANRTALERGLKTWLQSGHLISISLEIFAPGTTTLVRRWDLDWDKCDAAEAVFWADVVDIKYHLGKLGVHPSNYWYRFIVDRKPGFPAVEGWSKAEFADTSKLKKHCIGTTISAGGHGSRATYWK